VFEQDDKIYAEIFANESDHDEIRDFVTELNKKLPIFKRIYRVVFSENDLEKTAAGKIRRKYN
ncbi:MAG: long-chain fatty acid--CoA ligase, partial [Lachnospiraceae bacterium]|nr:long-chain fatty acid--CoA ligase [Lachnospiraceae bacterium]